MASRYNHVKIEKRWQRVWEKNKVFRALYPLKKKKQYCLIEFPYPSGEGLHVGHVRSYTAMDIIARKRRMEGFNVLYPIGWDAFGLPTEQYAVKTGIHPKIVTKKNTDNFRRQLKSLGFSFDWEREINTTDPGYYKWTQWIFLKFFEHGLAYKAKATINWCPKDKIGLANEEVIGGRCERCGTPVEKREKEQWMLKITAYAEKLLKGLRNVDYISEAKTQQTNWIGKSEGSLIRFRLESAFNQLIEVFTTRPDTLFGATYVVIAPEHPLITNNERRVKNYSEVKKYVEAAKARSEEDRIAQGREKTGVELEGIKAINPANGELLSVWVAGYVLGHVGTGAIMAVPAHDQRDFEFARKFGLPIKIVICPHWPEKTCPILDEAYGGEGHLVASGKFNGMLSGKARGEITKFVGGEKKIQYRLRDWVFSRQRYWGEPIPLIFCSSCKKLVGSSKPKDQNSKLHKGELLNPGWVAVPEKELPVRLPDVKKFQPRDDGESPLASMQHWVEVKCPRCGGPARRETDVMPNWAGSSWYFLRYADPCNARAFADRRKLAYWTPVDWYNGGMEHTVLHLLYSRFWHQFLYDLKLVPTNEPYKKRTSHGLILGEGGVKMSKSKGNVINPDDVIKTFGADTLRLYEMFVGPFNQPVAWDPHSIVGIKRFLERVWRTHDKIGKGKADGTLLSALHKTIKKVSDDIEAMHFNTAVSSLMVMIHEMETENEVPKSVYEMYLVLLAPFAPHIAEELWEELGHRRSIHRERWPVYNPALIEESTFELVVQVNGKVRDTFEVERGISQEEAEERSLARQRIGEYIKGKQVRKIIFVPNRLMNIVI